MSRVLCFSPNNAVWRWTFPQAQFLEALKKRGDEVVYVYCDREFSDFCMSMASSGVGFEADPARKAAICALCVRSAGEVCEAFGFTSRPLGDFLTQAERVETGNISANEPLESLIVFKVDNVPVGRFALYETVIQSKAVDPHLSPEAESLFRAVFRSTFVTALATRRMMAEIKPDVGITYHSAYAYNRAFQVSIEGFGIPVYFLNASFNVAELDTHLVAARSDPEVLFRKLLADWPRFEEVVCQPQEIQDAVSHLIALMSGHGFAYSVAMKRAGAAALERLGIPPGRKLLVAALSSYDELLAAELAGFGWSTHNDVFASQIEWVLWLFAEMRRRPDCHLVVRVHPREFGRGQAGHSEHANRLQSAFEHRPGNVSINLPSDDIPIYDLLLEADVALIAWSSAGMEAGMLGIPVITYFGDALLFPRSLTYEARSRDDYAEKLTQAIANGWSFERARAFLRWAVLMMARTRVDLTNGARPDVDRTRAGLLTRRIARRLRRMATRWDDTHWDIVTRPRHLRAAPRIAALIDANAGAFQDLPANDGGADLDLETRAIKRALRRLAGHVTTCTGRVPHRLIALADQGRGR
jgi:hypothetical protein